MSHPRSAYFRVGKSKFCIEIFWRVLLNIMYCVRKFCLNKDLNVMYLCWLISCLTSAISNQVLAPWNLQSAYEYLPSFTIENADQTDNQVFSRSR